MGNFLLEEDESYDVEVLGDIGVTDEDDTFELVIDELDDFTFLGQDYGFGVEMTDTGDDDTEDTDGNDITLEAGEVTMDIDKNADVQLQELRNDTDDNVLAVIEIVSQGEDATLEEINDDSDTFTIETESGATDEDDLTNIELRDTDGGVYDLTTAFNAATDVWTLTLDEEIYLPMGVTKTFWLEADIEDTMDNAVELRVYLEDGALTITGDESDADLDNITPTSVEGAKITIENASLGWASEELTSESAVEGADNVLIYVASLEAGDSSLVELNSFTLTENSGDAANAFDDDNIATLRAYLNGELLETASGDIEDDGVASSSITFNNLDNDYNIIPAGETYTLEVYADIEDSITADTFKLMMAVEADIDADDVDGNDVETIESNYFQTSRTVTLVEAGDLRVQLLTTDTQADDETYLLAGSETLADRYMAELEFTTENEEVQINELKLKQTGNAGKDDILYVQIIDEDGAVVFEEAPEIDGDVEFDFSTGEFVLDADKSTSYFIGVEAKKIDSEDILGTADFNTNVQFYIEDVEAEGVQSGDEITMTDDDGADMGEFSDVAYLSATTTIAGAVVTSITPSTVSDNSLGGDQIIGEYQFVIDNGENMKSGDDLEAALISLTLTLSSSTDVVVSNVQAYIEGSSSNKTDAAQPTSAAGVTTVDIDFTDLDSSANLVDGTVTVIVKATVGGDTTDGWLQTKIADVSTDFVWNADNVASGGTDFTGVRLDIDEVVGTKLQD